MWRKILQDLLKTLFARKAQVFPRFPIQGTPHRFSLSIDLSKNRLCLQCTIRTQSKPQSRPWHFEKLHARVSQVEVYEGEQRQSTPPTCSLMWFQDSHRSSVCLGSWSRHEIIIGLVIEIAPHPF